MNYAESQYFLSFIEIDGAFAYYESSPMILIEENNKIFKVSKTINVSSWGTKIDGTPSSTELDLSCLTATFIFLFFKSSAK